jgi:hypothetical protein
MNSACALGCVWLLAAWTCLAADSRPPLAVPLPPLARVSADDDSGTTWQQSGELGGSVASMRGAFMAALSAGGWALNKTIVLGRGGSRSELMVWVRNKRRILFMVWEKQAGVCGFAWGEEK